jgi:hypothetical protein
MTSPRICKERIEKQRKAWSMCAERSDKLIEITRPGNPKDDLLPIVSLRRTSPEREWKIKRLQEAYDLSRDIAERIADESLGSN